MTPPLVSVKVPTYNHERYIEACLDGILAQKTSFPFEVIVGEDGSTDGTRTIVETYAKAHPEVIRVVTSESNIGPARNLARIRAACRGAYEAMCEGDDLWIDPRKLQRQVDYLDTHPDCVYCFHDTLFYREDKGARPRYYCPANLSEFPTVADVLERPPFTATSSIVARRSFLDSLPSWRTQVLCSDLVVRLWGPHAGCVGYLKEVMALRRRHAGGLSMRTGHRRMAEEAIKAYRLFDEATGGRYRRLIRASIAFERHHAWLGPLCYAWHPARALARYRAFQTGAGL
ncbi:MAG: glycosyltransferase [Kiritimatiellae bacterium]|nr:glycosyltransferase [Kiritimatiellia bacterium]